MAVLECYIHLIAVIRPRITCDPVHFVEMEEFAILLLGVVALRAANTEDVIISNARMRETDEIIFPFFILKPHFLSKIFTFLLLDRHYEKGVRI